MLKRVAFFPIPFYIVFLVFFLLIAGTMVAVYEVRNAVYNYHITVNDKELIAPNFSYGSWPALSNPQFFHDVKEKMIQTSQNFIEADLSSMKIRMYENGRMIWEGAILTKGKPGSWWETPAGLYAVRYKAKSIFTGFGHVYMPEAMQFQGNFCIHGWPYYPDGTPVASAYSGGCIRLSTEDATHVYEWAKTGTPVLVYEADFTPDNVQYTYTSPQVDARSYMVADLRSDFIFTAKDTTSSVPIASLTKLMTALVATEYINLDNKITITEPMLVKTSKARLEVGHSYTAYQLLHPLLLESSNEAAFALSGFLGNTRFVSLMNEKTKAIGMTSTHFSDPAGMEDGNVSTAEDLFRLAKYIYSNRQFIFKLSAGHIARSSYDAPDFPNLQNFNVFQDDPEFVGGKVGQTGAARETILSVFDHKFGSTTRPLIVIVLGTEDNAAAAKALLSYVESSYSQTQ